MILAIRLWWATRRPWTCTLPDHTGFPCGTHGYGAATRQQHAAEHRAGLVGRYVCNTCHKRHNTTTEGCRP